MLLAIACAASTANQRACDGLDLNGFGHDDSRDVWSEQRTDLPGVKGRLEDDVIIVAEPFGERSDRLGGGCDAKLATFSCLRHPDDTLE